MKIVHVSQTPVAGAAAYLTHALRKFSNHEVIYISSSKGNYGNGRKFPSPDILGIDNPLAIGALEVADIIHLHNIRPTPAKGSTFQVLKDKPLIFQYHTPRMQRPSQISSKDQLWCCVAQLHMIGYPEAIPVPNVLPLSSPQYHDPPISTLSNNETLNLLWTPSNIAPYRTSQNDHSKGVPEAQAKLRSITGVHLEVHTNTPIDKLLPLKARAHIGVDDIVTGGYHRSALEFMALATPTICKVREEVMNWLTEWGNGEPPPFINIGLDDFVITILALKEDTDKLYFIAQRSREWMLKNWNEERTIQPYLKMYEEVA